MSVNQFSIGSGNGLLPVRRQATTWTNVDLLSIGLLGTNFSEYGIKILLFSFKKMQLKLSSAKMAAILARGRYSRGLEVDNPLVSLFGAGSFSHCDYTLCKVKSVHRGSYKSSQLNVIPSNMSRELCCHQHIVSVMLCASSCNLHPCLQLDGVIRSQRLSCTMAWWRILYCQLWLKYYCMSIFI